MVVAVATCEEACADGHVMSEGHEMSNHVVVVVHAVLAFGVHDVVGVHGEVVGHDWELGGYVLVVGEGDLYSWGMVVSVAWEIVPILFVKDRVLGEEAFAVVDLALGSAQDSHEACVVENGAWSVGMGDLMVMGDEAVETQQGVE